MKYDFNKVQDRIGSDSIKWEKQLKFGTKTGLLPFWIADTDFATLPEAVEAMKKRLEHPVFGYTTTGERTLETVRGWCLSVFFLLLKVLLHLSGSQSAALHSRETEF